MKTRTIHHLAAVFIGLLSTAASAATYYVAPAASGGSDANLGSLSQPWLTIEKAAATMVAGDTTLIRAGTYNLSQGVKPANSGTSGNPITFKAYPGEIVTANGGTHLCFSLAARSYITFDGLRMTTSDTGTGASMIYMENTNNCSFLNCEFFGLPPQAGNINENTSVIRCMAGSQFSKNCTFRNNYFHDNQAPSMHLYRTDGWVIENNEYRNGPTFIGGKDAPRNMLVRRNLMVNCTSGAALYFAGQHGSTNLTITENIVNQSSTPAFIIGGLGTEGAFRENTYFFNNTFYECRNFIVGWDDGFTRSQNYYNNIVYSVTAKNIGGGADSSARIVNMDRWGGTAMSSSNYFCDYNCLSIPANDSSQWFNNTGIAFTLAQWKTARVPFEAHSISTNPLFVNAAAGNFQLQAGSPCIGAGRNGENLGAYPRGNDGTVIGRLLGDTVAPVVSVTTPAAGVTVAGSSVSVTATATDNIGVVGVQFQLDGVSLGSEDITPPYGITWDTTSAGNSSHLLTAVARDAVGNATTSASVAVNVSNVGPEANLIGKGVKINDGATAPLATNATDFEGVGVTSGSLINTYTIQNLGGGVLTVGLVTVSGANSGDFAVIAQPASAVAAGGSTSFKVKFDPSALGVREANVSFSTNDADANPYNFAVQGRGEIIVDNRDAAGVTFLPSAAAWLGSTSSSGYFGINYLHDGNTNKGNMSVRFIPVLPSTGTYGVFARWAANVNRAEHVPIDIVTAEGVVPVEVNQKQSGGIWVPLGRYLFNTGSTGSVLLSNAGTTGYVVADAVKFVLQVINPGFETDVDRAQTVTGWSESGANPAASYVSASLPAHSGSRYLAHWMSSPYSIRTAQTRTDLPSGRYTLKAWVQRSGSQTVAQMEASDFGGTTLTVPIPVSATWTQISISDIEVTNGSCTFGFRSVAPVGAFIRVDDVEFYQQ